MQTKQLKIKFIHFFSQGYTHILYYCMEVSIYGMRRTITRHRMNTSSSSTQKKEHVFIGRQSSKPFSNKHIQSQWNVKE